VERQRERGGDSLQQAAVHLVEGAGHRAGQVEDTHELALGSEGDDGRGAQAGQGRMVAAEGTLVRQIEDRHVLAHEALDELAMDGLCGDACEPRVGVG